jgi:hypothetical protein
VRERATLNPMEASPPRQVRMGESDARVSRAQLVEPLAQFLGGTLDSETFADALEDTFTLALRSERQAPTKGDTFFIPNSVARRRRFGFPGDSLRRQTRNEPSLSGELTTADLELTQRHAKSPPWSTASPLVHNAAGNSGRTDLRAHVARASHAIPQAPLVGAGDSQAQLSPRRPSGWHVSTGVEPVTELVGMGAAAREAEYVAQRRQALARALKRHVPHHSTFTGLPDSKDETILSIDTVPVSSLLAALKSSTLPPEAAKALRSVLESTSLRGGTEPARSEDLSLAAHAAVYHGTSRARLGSMSRSLEAASPRSTAPPVSSPRVPKPSQRDTSWKQQTALSRVGFVGGLELATDRACPAARRLLNRASRKDSSPQAGLGPQRTVQAYSVHLGNPQGESARVGIFRGVLRMPQAKGKGTGSSHGWAKPSSDLSKVLHSEVEQERQRVKHRRELEEALLVESDVVREQTREEGTQAPSETLRGVALQHLAEAEASGRSWYDTVRPKTVADESAATKTRRTRRESGFREAQQVDSVRVQFLETLRRDEEASAIAPPLDADAVEESVVPTTVDGRLADLWRYEGGKLHNQALTIRASRSRRRSSLVAALRTIASSRHAAASVSLPSNRDQGDAVEESSKREDASYSWWRDRMLSRVSQAEARAIIREHQAPAADNPAQPAQTPRPPPPPLQDRPLTSFVRSLVFESPTSGKKRGRVRGGSEWNRGGDVPRDVLLFGPQ